MYVGSARPDAARLHGGVPEHGGAQGVQHGPRREGQIHVAKLVVVLQPSADSCNQRKLRHSTNKIRLVAHLSSLAIRLRCHRWLSMQSSPQSFSKQRLVATDGTSPRTHMLPPAEQLRAQA